MGKQELTINKLVTCLITLAMGLVTVCGLAAAVVIVTPEEAPWLVFTDIGFTYFGVTSNLFDSSYERLIPIGGVFNILQMLVGLAAIVLSVSGLLAFDAKKAKKLNMLFMIFCLIMLLWYLFEGIFFSELNDGSRLIPGFGRSSVNVTTNAYIPIIFGVLLFVAYFVCASQLPQTVLHRTRAAQGQPVQQPYYGAPVPPQQAAPQPALQPSAADSMEEKVKILTQYKQLLDSGILTQEEFDKLKAETLGKQ